MISTLHYVVFVARSMTLFKAKNIRVVLRGKAVLYTEDVKWDHGCQKKSSTLRTM